MKLFISCDWGTSFFRLRLVETVIRKIVTETQSAQGIAATYVLWKEQLSADRISFYCNFIKQQIKLLEKQYGHSLNEVPVVISGMASSTIGMIDLPYTSIPYKPNKAELQIYTIPPTKNFRHQMIVVSGVCSTNDVMRGEESMLAGLDIDTIKEEQLFIFPGTHSKHVIVQNGMVKNFKTYMTGELFDLLCSKSILAVSVEQDSEAATNNESFLKGVHEVLSSPFLNSIFHVRTSELFDQLSKKENYHFLSGMLIGEELKNIGNENYSSITVVSTGKLSVLYLKALGVICSKNKLIQKDSNEALIDGQAFILNDYH